MSAREYDRATVQVVLSDQASSRATTAALSALSQLRPVILTACIPSRWLVALLSACALSSSPSLPLTRSLAHSITCSLRRPCSVTAADCSDGPNVLGGRRVLVERHDVSMESCQPQRQRVSAFVIQNAWPTTTHCGHCRCEHTAVGASQSAVEQPYHAILARGSAALIHATCDCYRRLSHTATSHCLAYHSQRCRRCRR